MLQSLTSFKCFNITFPMRLSLTTQLRLAKTPQQPPKPFPYFIFLLITYLLKFLLGTSLETQVWSLVEKVKRGGHCNPLQYSCLENPHRQRSPGGYSPWGCKESDRTEWLSTAWRNQDWTCWMVWPKKEIKGNERPSLHLGSCSLSSINCQLHYAKACVYLVHHCIIPRT